MGIAIHPIHLGLDRCYVIQHKGVIMVDAGFPKKSKAFKQAISGNSINPREIQLLVLTHGHFDHVGSARDIQEITGARIAIHRAEKEWVERVLLMWPPAVTTWGHLLRGVLKPLTPLLFRFPATQVDMVLGDEGLSLAEYGIPGKVIHTPGHTSGSVSVLLETGDAFVGCMAHNGLPFRLRPGLPVFAEDLEQLRQSWQLLLSQGAKRIYPAHGEPFSADAIRKALS